MDGLKSCEAKEKIVIFIPGAFSTVAEIDEITDIDWLEDGFPPEFI